MHQHALAQADETRGGRYGAALPTTHVVGSTAVPNYPQASAPFQFDPVGLEPPLGFDNPALEPTSLATSPAQATDPTSADAATGKQRADVGSLSTLSDPTSEDPFPPSGQRGQRVGSSFSRRRL
jgi:hypothetical protein